jgi:hypothetical protein
LQLLLLLLDWLVFLLFFSWLLSHLFNLFLLILHFLGSFFFLACICSFSEQIFMFFLFFKVFIFVLCRYNFIFFLFNIDRVMSIGFVLDYFLCGLGFLVGVLIASCIFIFVLWFPYLTLTSLWLESVLLLVFSLIWRFFTFLLCSILCLILFLLKY